MKRPLIAFTAVFAAATYLQLEWNIFDLLRAHWFLIGTVLIFLFCALSMFTKLRPGLVLLSGALCGLLFAHGYATHLVKPILDVSNSTVTFAGVVQQKPSVYDDSQRVLVKADAKQLGIASPHPRVSLLLYVPLTEQPIRPGDSIEVTAQLYRPGISDGFDRASYYSANGIFLFGRYAEQKSASGTGDGAQPIHFIVRQNANPPVWCMPLQAVDSLESNLQSNINPRYSGFVSSILFGDKSHMDALDNAHMRKSGLSHVSAVSGMNIAFLVGFLVLVCGRRFGAGLSILAILFFIPMAGASPSVIRAAIMYIMTSVAFYLRRENDTLTALCFALLVLLCMNPFSIYSMSLQLSFASSLGLILFSYRVQTYLMRPFANMARPLYYTARFVVGSITASVCALLFTLPICLSSFGYVSFLSPLANLLVVSVIGFIFLGGLLLSVFGGVIPLLGHLLGTLLAWVSSYTLWVAKQIAALPYGLLYHDNAYGMAAVFVFYAAAILLLLFSRRIKPYFVLAPACACLIALTAFGISESRDTMQIHILPCGTGQSILAAIVPGQVTLIDCSASSFRNAAETVQQTMDWYGYDHIDTLILTSVDKTHARNVPELLQAIPTGQIIFPKEIRESTLSEQIRQTATQKKIPLTVWSAVKEQDTSANGVSLIGGIDRKLIVRLRHGKSDVLLLHSITQKMLETYLQTHPLTADTLVLSESNIADAPLLQAALQKIQPQHIILESGHSRQDRIVQYKVRNTYAEGKIDLHLLGNAAREGGA